MTLSTSLFISVGEETYENEPEKGQVINRNCEGCINCCDGRLFVPWLYFQQICFKIIAEPLFDLFIILCIILNTAFMAAEHHNQPEFLTQLLDVSNYVSYQYIYVLMTNFIVDNGINFP